MKTNKMTTDKMKTHKMTTVKMKTHKMTTYKMTADKMTCRQNDMLQNVGWIVKIFIFTFAATRF